MATYLIDHLRIPGGIPTPEGLDYLENVEATFKPYGGKWLVFDAQVEVLEGAWPGSAVLMEFPDMASAKNWYNSPEYQKIRPVWPSRSAAKHRRVPPCPDLAFSCKERVSDAPMRVSRCQPASGQLSFSDEDPDDAVGRTRCVS